MFPTGAINYPKSKIAGSRACWWEKDGIGAEDDNLELAFSCRREGA